MERIRFCRECGEAFGWDLAACPACKHAVSKRPLRRSRTAPARRGFPWIRLTRMQVTSALVFLAVIALLTLLAWAPVGIFN